jgi:hypothetical protein
MPLTQDTVIAILREAEEMREAHLALRKEITETCERATRDPSTSRDVLAAMITGLIKASPIPHDRVCAVMAYHYRKSYRRNERERARARNARAYKRGLPGASGPPVPGGKPFSPIHDPTTALLQPLSAIAAQALDFDPSLPAPGVPSAEDLLGGIAFDAPHTNKPPDDTGAP